MMLNARGVDPEEFHCAVLILLNDLVTRGGKNEVSDIV